MSQNRFQTDYIDVAERIVEARAQYPDGRLRPADPSKPYTIENIDGQTYIVVVAAFYRNADDQLPGIGMAYEVFPGKSNFTRGSELQNAETSAWGRAMVAALVADTKRGVASANEVRNRVEERENPLPPDPVTAIKRQLQEIAQSDYDEDWVQRMRDDFAEWSQGKDISAASLEDLTQYRNHLRPEPTRRMSRAKTNGAPA